MSRTTIVKKSVKHYTSENGQLQKLDKIMKNVARQKIVAEKGKESYNTWLSKLRGSSYISYVLPEFNDAQKEIDIKENWDPFS